MIHRDIKPANLIRRQWDNKIVLIDFGAVKEIRSLSPNQQTAPLTVAIGKPQLSSNILAKSGNSQRWFSPYY